jgi:hypothetical protein
MMDGFKHGLINYKDTKVKFSHLKKLTCKGPMRQVFIRVYRLEIQKVMLLFSTQFWSCCPSNLLWFSSPPPSLREKVYCKYTRIQCVRGGYEVLGLRQINTCRKVPLQVNFF